MPKFPAADRRHTSNGGVVYGIAEACPLRLALPCALKTRFGQALRALRALSGGRLYRDA